MNTTVGNEHVDILCVGSSHMYCGINPIQMYRDKGYATYMLAIGSQAPWQSLYYIKESCKTQSPKLVICDVYTMGTREPEEYKDYQTAANLLDTPLSFNKIQAVMASTADSRLDLLLRFPYIHDDYERFDGLSRRSFSVEKFYGVEDYSMGYTYYSRVEKTETNNVGAIAEASAINPVNEKYLRKIIEYCQGEGIQVLLINAPWPCAEEEDQKHFNYIRLVAEEYGVDLVNGCDNWEALGIDYNTDCYGNGGHLNHSGVTKFTNYVEEYISDNFDIPDRRDDADYAVYENGIIWLEDQQISEEQILYPEEL